GYLSGSQLPWKSSQNSLRDNHIASLPASNKELSFCSSARLVNDSGAASWMNRLSSRPSSPSVNRTHPPGSSTSVRSAASRAIASSSLASAETISASQNFTFSASPRSSNAVPSVTTGHPYAVSS